MSVINLRDLAGLVSLPSDARRLPQRPEQEVRTTLNTVRSGAVLCADSYLVIHCSVRGPGKGGIRMSADVDMRETARLAELMTYKSALVGIPLGGARSGIRLDHKIPYRSTFGVVVVAAVLLSLVAGRALSSLSADPRDYS